MYYTLKKFSQTTWNFLFKSRLHLCLLWQWSKSSDFSLISDFLPTPRTILEISRNLKRKFFWRVGGRGIWLKQPTIAPECTPWKPWSQKFSGGEPPDPPAYITSCKVSVHASLAHHYTQHCTLFRLFLRHPFWPCVEKIGVNWFPG